MQPLLSQPQHYPNRILLLASGMSPQIVTETLYALIHKKDNAFVPTQIHLLTTRIGAEQARLNLLEGNQQFYRFCEDYKISPQTFDASHIHIIQDEQGHTLDDIRTPEENEITADFITRHMLKFTADDNTAVHVSIAGGRKTMGYYAGYALSLFGRSQDRLSHVLVSAGYEGLREFYYPTPYAHTIYNRDNQALDASKAAVSLAEIPFVRLRSGLPQSLLEGNHGFSQTVALARLANEPASLTLKPKQNSYSVNGEDYRLSSLHMALLLWVADRRKNQQPPIQTLLDDVYTDENRRLYAQELTSICERHWLMLHARTEDTLEANGVTKGWLESNISKLNNKLEKQLGSRLVSRYKLATKYHPDIAGYDLPQDTHIDIVDTP